MHAVTICPPAPPRQGLSFDTYNCEGRRSKKTDLDFQSFEKMHVVRPSDLRKGRRIPVPDWAHNAAGLQTALVHYLEKRYFIKPNPADDLKTRLTRCQEKVKADAAPVKRRLETWIKNYRAIAKRDYHEAEERIYERLFLASLRGDGPDKVLKSCFKHISNLDSEYYIQARIAQLTLSILFLYYRMGWKSNDVAQELDVKAPHVRQILYRVSRRVRKTDALRGRPKKVKS
jgi:hypothetical protein